MYLGICVCERDTFFYLLTCVYLLNDNLEKGHELSEQGGVYEKVWRDGGRGRGCVM